MSETIFRRLLTSESEQGYSIYLEAIRWLNANGIRQWLAPLPRSVYDRRQALGENYGLFMDGCLTVVLSLVCGTPHEWADIVVEAHTWWLQNLATAEGFRGKRLGESAVSMAGEHLLRDFVPEVYLDCVDVGGFLPGFYQKLGFVKVCGRNITYPSGNTYPMVLMRRELNDALPNSLAANAS
jgi:ribosomal protein S18 acetylase RimI-like enzyme